MGYSARYHAASLAAVFLALAIGIVIGAGLGDDLLSDTEQNLRESLEEDIENARGEADELQSQLDRERAFSSRAFPALVADELLGRRVGVLAFGDLPEEAASDIEAALEPAGAELVEVVVVRRPPEVGGLAEDLGTGFSGIETDDAQLGQLGRTLGLQFVQGGGRQLDRVRDTLFARSSGEGGRVSGLVIVRAPVGELEPEEEAAAEALEAGMLTGIAESPVVAVGVERSDVSESSVEFFEPVEIATVDSVDLSSGRVALVFALLGAEGNFGIKGSADSLIPELLEPSQRDDDG